MSVSHTVIDTPIGLLTLVATPLALREVRFPHGRPIGPADGPAEPGQEVLAQAARELAEYFDGSRLDFDVALDPQGSPFQLAAWRGLRALPYGTTVSYGEQARRLGHDGKARAIGAANGRNPIPIVMPCHRVVGSDGSLTGFGGGIETKAWLLHHEQQVIGAELRL